MPRQPKPWPRGGPGGPWYAQIRGRQVRLGDGSLSRTEAQNVLYRLLAGEGQPRRGTAPTFATVADVFLEQSAREHKPSTHEQYRIKLQSACDSFGDVRATDLKPSHVSRWLAAHEWSDSTRRGAITYVKLALNHAVDEGLIPANPLHKVKRPRMRSREKTLTADERRTILADFDDGFRDFLVALGETGARPGELIRLEARMIDWQAGVATLRESKTADATGRPRVLYLTGAMVELCRRLAEVHPKGPLFRNRDGNPWTTNAVRCRFRRLRSRRNLDPKIVAYTFRHSFITDGLENGVGVAAIAELAGHSDWKMVQDVYSKLRERREHLRREAERAAGPTPSDAPGT
jgi:integrase